jgi:hypothetical protein
MKSRYRSVSIATDWTAVMGQEIFSLLHSVQTGPGGHPASYPIVTLGAFPSGNAAGA